MSKTLIYKTLWRLLPILNYLFCIIVDWIESLNNVNNAIHPPLYWNIYVIGNVLLLYGYIFIYGYAVPVILANKQF